MNYKIMASRYHMIVESLLFTSGEENRAFEVERIKRDMCILCRILSDMAGFMQLQLSWTVIFAASMLASLL